MVIASMHRRRRESRHTDSRRHSAWRSLIIAVAGFVLAAASVVVAPSTARASATAPLLLLPELTLAQQFGYEPAYPLNVPSFDTANMPVVRERGSDQSSSLGVYTWAQASWSLHEYWSAITRAVPDATGIVNGGGWETDRIVVTRDGVYYSALTISTAKLARVHVMLRSQDAGATWTAWRLPHSGATAPPQDLDFGDFTFEYFVGHNEPVGPPTVAYWQRGKRAGRWASKCKLFLTAAHMRYGKLVLDPSVLVSRRALGVALVAGAGSQMVTVGDRTFIVYTELARPEDRGSPVYVATYDRTKKKITSRVLLAYSKPIDDLHCTPAICTDSRGFLHVVLGAHGASFRSTSSLQPGTADKGWAVPRLVLATGYVDSRTDADGRGRQTYVALVCDQHDVLHLVSRQWRRKVDDLFGGSAYGALVHQYSRPGGGWSRPAVLATSPVNDYVNFYHKLSIDRRGRLFVSASVWTGPEAVETRSSAFAGSRYQRRMLFVCDDGVTWRLATDADLTVGFGRLPKDTIAPSSQP